MDFSQRLAALRKKRNMTQQMLAEKIGVNVLQIKRYEGGASQPTVDVIRRLAVALGVSSDTLVFDEEERGPDDALRYQFEAITRMSGHEKEIVKELLEAIILKNQVTGAVTGTIKRTTQTDEKRSA